MKDDTEHTNSQEVSDMSEADSPAKRRLLSGLGAGGGVLGVSALVPATWIKPVVDAVMLPAHAQPSPAPGNGGGGTPPGNGGGGTPPGNGGGGTPPAQEQRGAPTSVTAVVSSAGTGLSVAWVAAPTGVDSYTVSYRKSDEQDFRADVATVAGDAPSLTHTFTFPQDEDLQADETFTVEVTAMYAQSGNQAATTHPAVMTTAPFVPPVVPPSEPEQRGGPASVTATLSVTNGVTDGVNVIWSAAPVGVDSYVVHYRKSTEQDFRSDGVTVQADATLAHTFTFPQSEALQDGDIFTVQVVAVYGANGTQLPTTHPSMDNTPAFEEEDTEEPQGAPAIQTNTYASGVISITWSAPVGATVTGYYIRWSRNRGQLNSTVDSISGNGRAVNSTVTSADLRLDVPSGERYYVFVRALYASDGDGSDTIAASPNTSSVVGPSVP